MKKEQWIRRAPDYQNIIQLYRCLKTHYDYNFVCNIKNKLAVNKVLAVGDLIEQQSELPWLYKLIAEQIVEMVPSSQLLSQDATVKWRSHEQNN